ncbi:MAG: TetR/AcrR family transcriptional regulator [Actinomycetota bacterium]|nr:TetR/AcrR family transcriptional regulator [Actinomycetota bacterium]
MGTSETDNGATRLRDAALVLFGENGFEGTSVRAIAERAGVTAGLVLHHYGSKQGLREAVDQYVLDSVRAAWTDLTDIAADADHLALRQRGFQILFQQHPYMGRYLRRALLESSDAAVAFFDGLMDLSRSLFDSLRAAGLAQPTDDPDAQVLLSMVLGLMPVLLPRHLERNLGISLRSNEGLQRWTAAEYEFLTHGSLRATPAPAKRAR